MKPLTQPKSVSETPCSLGPAFVSYKTASHFRLQVLFHFFLTSFLCAVMRTSVMYFSVHFTAVCSYACFTTNRWRALVYTVMNLRVP